MNYCRTIVTERYREKEKKWTHALQRENALEHHPLSQFCRATEPLYAKQKPMQQKPSAFIIILQMHANWMKMSLYYVSDQCELRIRDIYIFFCHALLYLGCCSSCILLCVIRRQAEGVWTPKLQLTICEPSPKQNKKKWNRKKTNKQTL